ncbi:Gfo/Idh/MocA family protein [Cohnella abietis]|uniref:Oxidoreductase n=1 Tax=Cohnella abietis TaxID=2507935 RepID=A0A3T1DDW2_9BACL|nr:Gfo/Idh/MocA family oxidoreductase [Cohnella abietis]BBI36283.1 oxidoreductase [Cohnella abietis]
MNELRIGLIGTDTSHAVVFSSMINDIHHKDHIPGGRVVCAYAGGSADFPLSISRVDDYMNLLSDRFGILKMDSLQEVAESCDAILLESADGRVHLEQFQAIAPYGKPVFIDKPLALSAREAAEIHQIAKRWGTPIMSSSSLRYAEQMRECLAAIGRSNVAAAETRGPFIVEPTQSVYFWYGIHSVEMLYAILGTGCASISAWVEDDYEIVTGRWHDGRIGTVRLERRPDSRFGAVIHGEDKQRFSFEISPDAKPFYASLLEQIMNFFRTKQSPIQWSETAEIIRFLEAAEESRKLGGVPIPT